MRRFEANRKAKGLLGLAVLKEFDGLLAHNPGKMFSIRASRKIPTLAGKTIPGVKFVAGHIPVLFPQLLGTISAAVGFERTVLNLVFAHCKAKLADKAGSVSILLQKTRVTVFKFAV